MAPIAISALSSDPEVEVAQPKKDTLGLPAPTRERLLKAGIDLSGGYPYRPARPLHLQDVFAIRNEPWKHDDAGARADKSKNALLSAATKVTHLTGHIGTEIEGLQLKDLTNQQRDELALLIAERSVVVRDICKCRLERSAHKITIVLPRSRHISSAAEGFGRVLRQD